MRCRSIRARASGGRRAGSIPVSAAVKGGDDYELLFAVPPRGGGALRSVARHVADPPLTKIGVFTKDPRELVIARGGERGRVTGRV